MKNLAALLALAPALLAQNAPHLAYVFPAGGQAGTTFQVNVGGQFLAAVTGVSISGGGITAVTAGYTRPMTGMQATELRDQAQELQKRPNDPAAQKELAEVRLKLATFNRNINPVLAETQTLEVTVAAGAAIGRRELRLISPQGLSNPLVFCVGQLPEFTEKQSEVRILVAGLRPADIPADTAMPVTLPATINGRIMPRPARPQQAQFTPGEADHYRFQARRGQRLVISASARELVPYLADAVPGWFQPTLSLLDDQGNELAYDDDYRFHPDPVLFYEVPKDGEYEIVIKDAIYRGREDFVYRISVGELPFVTSVFPLGGKAGGRSAVAVSGWNLPVTRLVLDTGSPGVHTIPIGNRVPYAVDTLPEILEKESNDAQKSAQRVKLPVIVNGRVDRPGDQDVFAFQGRAGEQIVAEVCARRLESPLDSTLRLTNAAGRQLAFNDDHEDKGAGLLTHQADSLIAATLPANGTYYLYLNDAQHKGGPEYGYRLRISHPQPDFDLRVTPSAINAGRGMAVPIDVYALRKDGFSGEISLALKGAPRGVALNGGTVPAGQDHVQLTLWVPAATPVGDPFTLDLEGRATIQGREVTRLAVPADDMMQAFAWHQLVPAESLKLALVRRVVFRTPARVLDSQPVRIPAGGSTRVRVEAQLPPNNLIARLHFELSDPPDGISLGETSAATAGSEIVVQCDAAKAKAGLKGNLIISILGERQPPPGNAAARPAVQRVPLGVLPAVPFEIVPR